MPNDKEQLKFSLEIAQTSLMVGVGMTITMLGITIISLFPAIWFIGMVFTVAGLLFALWGVLKLNNLKKELK